MTIDAPNALDERRAEVRSVMSAKRFIAGKLLSNILD
jgi:hypothetical protein